jgi:hypothetical protein
MEPEVAPQRRPLGELFVERGYLTADELSSALDEQRRTGNKLGEILIERGQISRLALAGILSEQWEDDRHVRTAPPVALRQVAAPEPQPPAVSGMSEEEVSATIETRVAEAVAELEQRLATPAVPVEAPEPEPEPRRRGALRTVVGALLLLAGFAGMTALLWLIVPVAGMLAACAGATALGMALLLR